MAEAARPARGVLDTSVVIDLEQIDALRLPLEVAISAVTLAELAAGPHATSDPDERGRRQDRLQRTEAAFDPLPFDGDAARAYGRIFAAVAAAGQKGRGRGPSTSSSPPSPCPPSCRSTPATGTTSAPSRDSSTSVSSDGTGTAHVQIVIDDLTGPAIVAFLSDHVEEMRTVTPPESSHALDVDGLRAPEVTVWSISDGHGVVACGALKELDAGHAEIKSMRTAASHRGQGLADRILRHMIDEAGRRGYRRLSLETGSEAFFAPARRLYGRHGFTYCEPFGDYLPDPLSVFMTRVLV